MIVIINEVFKINCFSLVVCDMKTALYVNTKRSIERFQTNIIASGAEQSLAIRFAASWYKMAILVID